MIRIILSIRAKARPANSTKDESDGPREAYSASKKVPLRPPTTISKENAAVSQCSGCLVEVIGKCLASDRIVKVHDVAGGREGGAVAHCETAVADAPTAVGIHSVKDASRLRLRASYVPTQNRLLRSTLPSLYDTPARPWFGSEKGAAALLAGSKRKRPLSVVRSSDPPSQMTNEPRLSNCGKRHSRVVPSGDNRWIVGP